MTSTPRDVQQRDAKHEVDEVGRFEVRVLKPFGDFMNGDHDTEVQKGLEPGHRQTAFINGGRYIVAVLSVDV
eukprot:CAMPEP_0171794156 /NCGR_PEP_ID=MMETSP0991-20121206/67965_1 /TAXON_ID=483369 /ORGANISM="non described non described, Strain CCMP2098" /LENGTH=71 /DNA_ID=CAMNT_0012404519 /DNA_START=282 /DNA_END=497 /DNA_ORIENTATION=+